MDTRPVEVIIAEIMGKARAASPVLRDLTDSDLKEFLGTTSVQAKQSLARGMGGRPIGACMFVAIASAFVHVLEQRPPDDPVHGYLAAGRVVGETIVKAEAERAEKQRV